MAFSVGVSEERVAEIIGEGRVMWGRLLLFMGGDRLAATNGVENRSS
jgi:hypothetical protein